jgi:transglutaminase/protease-like cytokinesis protein 3
MKCIGLLIFVTALAIGARGQSNEIQKADSIAGLYPGHSLNDLGLLSYKLTASLSGDKSKFRAIYRWVCTNIQGDYDLMEYCKRRRAKLKGEKLDRWSKEFNELMIQILIDKHRTLCKGYAWLVRELALRAGMDCEIIPGYSRSARSNIGGSGIANHSWNAVLLDGKWYLCDPTWASGIVTPENEFTNTYNDEYFLADPAWFILNHYPLDVKWTLMECAPDLHEFLNQPLVYIGAFKYKVKPAEPSSFRVTAKRGQNINFYYLQNGMEINRQTSFSKRGTYPYHIKVNNECVISYKVTVH